VKHPTEIELKFLVPQAARAAVMAELERGVASLDRTSLTALYLDTADRRLARAGMSWRLRREGRRWIQALKSVGSNPLERFEHAAIRPDASPDASEHAGTVLGNRLIGLLRRAHAEGIEPGVRFRTEVRRTARRIRTRGALVEVAFDEGRLVAADASQRIRELEFELVSGSPQAMLALVERWRKRFGLIHDPRSKAERGDRLADGVPFPPLRKAARPSFTEEAATIEAFGLVLDECLAHITRSAIGVAEGDPDQRVEHVHQLRVGIRRLRSALRSFDGWVPMPPAELVAALRSLFATLGMSRDSDVLASGVMAELAQAGAPPLALPPGPSGPEPADVVRADDAQRTLLAWIAWRAALTPPTEAAADPAVEVPANGRSGIAAAGPVEGEPSGAAPDDADDRQTGATASASGGDARTFRRNASRRLRRWHARIVADWQSFDDLDDAGLHALRKRIKRQRYAVEFFAPVLRRRQVERYLDVVTVIQDRMGALNDLFVARARHQALDPPDPAAWFALGWLAARIAQLRALAKPELAKLARTDPPTH
jgi:inorganic triphosphatase YgiF